MTARPHSLDQLLPSAYDQLRALAQARLRRSAAVSLETMTLVHEAYLRLVASNAGPFADREHFLAVASLAMRNILVDHARTHTAAKRGGSQVRVPLSDDLSGGDIDIHGILELDDALQQLARIDRRHALIIECRYFGGLTLEETADGLGVSLATVKRDERVARAWLAATLSPVVA